jgi:class 3 adenylate cyclase
MEWIEAFQRSGGLTESRFSQQEILEKLRSLEGVVRADLQWSGKDSETAEGPERGMGMGMGMGHSMGPMMRFSRSRIEGLSPPRYNADQGTETVMLTSDLLDDDGDQLGRLEVEIRFKSLLEDIFRMGWWQSETAYVTDEKGKILLNSGADSAGRKQLGESGDPLELQLLEKMKKQSFGTVLGPGHPPDKVAGFCRTEDAGWTIVLVAPGSRILAPIVRFRNAYFLAGAAVILLVLVLIRLSTGRMVRSVQSLSEAAGRIARGEYTKVAESGSGDEIGRLARSFNEMVEGLQERDFIRRTFGRYMDHEVARRLLAQPSASRLGGKKREVAILMSDIRGFTPMAETLSPEDTLRVLNQYFSHMIGVVEAHGGIIVDFLGDSVLVFFDPFDGPLKPEVLRAVRCGLEMQTEMERFGSEIAAEGLPAFEMGIGIHAGDVVVGNIGSETRAKYGIVGTAVNLTQRIQAASEGGQVVVSEPVVRCANDCLTIERTFEANLKGIREPVMLAVVSGCAEAGEATGR